MKAFILFFSILAFSLVGLGQKKNAKPDFSGTWNFSKSENLMDNNPAGSYTMIIVQNDPELKITFRYTGKKTERNEVYFTDNRGESNTFSPDKISETTTKWDGKKILIMRVEKDWIRDPRQGKNKEIVVKFTDRWELSKDGNTLTITTPAEQPGGIPVKNLDGDGSPKRIYTRAN